MHPFVTFVFFFATKILGRNRAKRGPKRTRMMQTILSTRPKKKLWKQQPQYLILTLQLTAMALMLQAVKRPKGRRHLQSSRPWFFVLLLHFLCQKSVIFRTLKMVEFEFQSCGEKEKEGRKRRRSRCRIQRSSYGRQC